MFKTNALNSSTSGAYVDKNDSTSTPGTRLEADDRNIIQDEFVDLVESSGQTTNSSGNFTTQVPSAVANYSSGGGEWYEDTGGADDYELDRFTSGSNFTLPSDYFSGMKIKFEAATTNTGASVVEVGSLGTKSLVDTNKAALSAGDITAGDLIESWYDPTTSSGVFVTPAINKVDGFYDAYLKYSDTKSNNTAGGASGATTTQIRTLNTEDADTAGIGSLSSNQVTLPAGDYVIKARAPGRQVDRHKASLYDVTGATTLLIGESVETTTNNMNCSEVIGKITLGVQSDLEVRHYTTAAQSDGLGIATNSGLSEVYTTLEIWRLV